MGSIYESIDSNLRKWIEKQHMFMVGTAPSSNTGSVNVSPKGHDTLRVIDEHTLAFLDYGGSGVETIAHVRENQRIVIMMCAFEGPPKIYRFHGQGEIITPLDDGFELHAKKFDRTQLGIRSIVLVHITRISDSCGFGVPFYAYKGQRPSSPNYIRNNGVGPVREYLAQENLQSLDGLSGVTESEARAYLAPTGRADTDKGIEGN
jgi:predicted pyridoxine 5'-phosphate oxidase superfamily flavin-nucleotide-binding protein